MLSGSWPGELHLFLGTEGGYAASTVLQGTDGKRVHVGQASAPALADWDGDGDLDLLVGNVGGAVFWLPNETRDGKVAFGPATAVRAGDEEISVPHGDAGPCVADWDQDGRPDLLVGAGDGSVAFHRNLAAEGTPVLAAGVTLVPAGSFQGAAKDGAPARGARAKVCVADWDADGRPDLLVGDFVMLEGEPPALSEADRAEKAGLEARLEPLAGRLQDRYEAHRLLALKQLGLKAPLAEGDAERVDQATSEGMGRDRTLRRLQQEMSELHQALARFRAPTSPHGHVWVFRR